MPLRNRYSHSSIRFQLFRLILMVSAIALAISMVGGALLEWNKQQEQVSRSLATTGRAAGIAASAALSFEDRRAATEALRVLEAQKRIEAAALYTLDGKRFVTYGEVAGLPESTAQLSQHLPGFDPWSATTTLFQPVLLDDVVIGHIFIRASLLDYRQTYLLQAMLSIGANLLGLLLAIGFGLRFIDRIIKPVRDLAETSRQVRASRDFSLRATPPDTNTARDETTELIDSFNAMLAEIEQREHELENYHSGLEQMVRERTIALHGANREMQMAKEAAEAANMAKSRFLAAASHDLRQPIQAINLFKEALDKTALDSEQKRISAFLSRSISSLGELLDALLDISKLDAGAITPTHESISVHALFTQIDAEFSNLATVKHLRFKLQFPFADISLSSDGKLLQSLLRNLIGNAIKYTERGGVLVAIRRRGTEALIQVWDTGIGIAPEHLGTIFDEYFQVANPERDKAKGLGLGLAIARRLAKLLKTEISCHSRPGHGSVFAFRLPLAQPPASDETHPAGQEDARIMDATALAGRRIAIIEDDALVAQALQVSLEAYGMQTIIYGSAEAALAHAAIGNADFYISDFRLPGANGVALLEGIQQRVSRRIKAVLLTGETSPGWIELTQSARWPILFKPVDLPTLVTAIRAQDNPH